MAEATFAFDLHVLSTPPAFNLSQNQTLQFKSVQRFLLGRNQNLKVLFPLALHLSMNQKKSFSLKAAKRLDLKMLFCHRFVNNFFKKIRTTYIANKSGERGIRTLAPVTRPIPLAGAPLRPLEYFSKVHNCQYDVVRYVCDAFNILLNFYLFVNPYFLYFILPVTVASFQTSIDPAYIFVNITT